MIVVDTDSWLLIDTGQLVVTVDNGCQWLIDDNGQTYASHTDFWWLVDEYYIN